MVSGFSIGERPIGPGAPCFLIAEAGVNHDGDLDKAIALIDAAAATGADAVKFQTFSAERLAGRDAPKAAYQKVGNGAGESQFDMLKRLELSEADHFTLADHCRTQGILFLSSPFDEIAADFLADQLRVPAFKVPSGELTNHAYLSHLAAKGLPIILSTGMATEQEVAEAVTVIGSTPLALLHCVSAYPADPGDCNLAAIGYLRERFDRVTGWSDHTLGIEVGLAAAALGASIIEKHFTLDKNSPGPDHKASMEPSEFSALVQGVRKIEAALGKGGKVPTNAEQEIAAVARKSLVAAKRLEKGAVLTAAMVVSRRPGTGIPPSHLNNYIGRRLAVTVEEGALLAPTLFED